MPLETGRRGGIGPSRQDRVLNSINTSGGILTVFGHPGKADWSSSAIMTYS